MQAFWLGEWGVVLLWQLKAVVLISLLGLFLAGLRFRDSRVRASLWASGLIGLLLIPLVDGLGPDWRVLPTLGKRTVASVEPLEPVPGAETVGESNAAVNPSLYSEFNGGELLVASREREGGEHRRAPELSSPSNARIQVESSSVQMSRGHVGFLLWGAGCGVLLFRLLLGGRRMRYLIRQGRSSSGARLKAELDRAQAALKLRVAVRLVVLPAGTIPMTAGLFRPVIFLPEDAEAWPDGQLQAILRHELAHVKRWDCWWLLVAQCACAVYWFNPCSWWARRGMVHERERACDDLVVASGIRPAEYARALLAVGSRVRVRPLQLSTVAEMSGSSLQGRIRRIVTVTRPSRPAGSWQWGAGLVFVVATVLGAADFRSSASPARDFSERVARWAVMAVETEYPERRDSKEVATWRAELVTFLDDVLATNQLARSRAAKLEPPLERFMTRQFFGGDWGGRQYPQVRKDGYGRQLPQVRLRDDWLTLKWKLWWALTKPELSGPEQSERVVQKALLHGYLTQVAVVHQEVLKASYKNPEPGGESLVQRWAMDGEEWRGLREWVLLEDSYSDPLDVVFDRPLPAEDFDAVVATLRTALTEAGSVREVHQLGMLPHVRRVAALVWQHRYPRNRLRAAFRVPFDDRIIALHGSRSFDDPVHLRFSFGSTHPEDVGQFDPDGQFRVAPGESERRPLQVSYGVGASVSALDCERVFDALTGPYSGRRLFLPTGNWPKRSLVTEVSIHAGLTAKEREIIEDLVTAGVVWDIDSLAQYVQGAKASPLEVAASAKLQALRRQQVRVIQTYEALSDSGRLPEAYGEVLRRLVKGLKAGGLSQLRAQRQRFRGLGVTAGRTTWTRLKPVPDGQGGVVYSGFLLLGNRDAFPLWLNDEAEALCHGKMVAGDDEALELELRSSQAEEGGKIFQVPLKRDEQCFVLFGAGYFEFYYGSTWVSADANLAEESDAAHVWVTYRPDSRSVLDE